MLSKMLMVHAPNNNFLILQQLKTFFVKLIVHLKQLNDFSRSAIIINLLAKPNKVIAQILFKCQLVSKEKVQAV